MSARILALTFVLACAAPAFAQPSAECPTSECLPTPTSASPVHAQLWRDAAAIHQIKIAFVDAVQRFLRAQAGTFGDEGEELRASVAAMRASLWKWDQAIQQFEARARGDAEFHIAMATVWLDRHRLDAALRALAAAEQIDDRRADLYAMRALAYGASNRRDEAVRALRRGVVLDPRDPTLIYSLVRRLTQSQQPDNAAQVRRTLPRSLATARRVAFARVGLLSQAAGTAPIFPQARYAAGIAALEAGDYESALAALDTAIATDPLLTGGAAARPRLSAAASALRSGQIEAALQHLQDAVESSADESEVHRLLGLVYWIDDQPGKSIEHLRRAIQVAPADERARVLLADVLTSDRRLAEAERVLTQAVEAGVRSGLITYRLAQLYQRQALLPQAAKAFEDSERFGPVVGRDRFYLEWGSLLVNQADFDGAAAVYGRRIDVNPNSAEAHRQAGEIHFLQGRDEEALAEFSVAIWLDPKDAKAHAAAGQVHARLMKHAEAAAALQRALALDGSLREARYALGTVLMRAGKTSDARRELDLFARQQADAEAAGQREFQLDSLRRQAAKEALAGNHERALALYQDASALDSSSARSRRDMGVALLRAKRFSEAIEPLSSAQKIEDTAEGYAFLVEAHSALGDANEAERQRGLYRQYIARKKIERVRNLGGR